MAGALLAAVLFIIGGVPVFASYYQAGDPCRYMTYDYLSQLCCNGVIYVDAKLVYTCCGSNVCYAANRTLANPAKLLIVRTFQKQHTVNKLPIKTTANKAPPVRVNQYVRPAPNQPQMIGFYKPATKMTTTAPPPPLFGANSFRTYPIGGESRRKTYQDQPPQSSHLNMPRLPQSPKIDFPDYGENFVPSEQQQFFNNRQLASGSNGRPMVMDAATSAAPVDQAAQRQLFRSSFAAPFGNFSPVLIQPDLFCDGINLSQLRQTNPHLACCANMVIYDERTYSCNPGKHGSEVDVIQQQQPASTSTTAVAEQPSTTSEPPTTTSSQQPSAMSSFLISMSTSPAITSKVSTEPEPNMLNVTTPSAPTFPPIKLPTDFVSLFCNTHVYYLEPVIAGAFKCCGEDLHDMRKEYCQSSPNLYRVLPIDPSEPSQRDRLDCGRTTTFIFASKQTADKYSC